MLVITVYLYATEFYYFVVGCEAISLTVDEEINELIPGFYNYLQTYVFWPTLEEWNGMRNSWPSIPNILEFLDGTIA